MYSALFLSATIPAIMEPPPALQLCEPFYVRANDPLGIYYTEGTQWECEIRSRLFFYALTLSMYMTPPDKVIQNE
jgi:hypothetical protein